MSLFICKINLKQKREYLLFMEVVMKNYVIGVDLGGTKISTALSTFEGNIISQTVVPTNASEGEIPVLNRIISSINEVINGANITINEVEAIGIGSPGPLDAKKG